MTQVMWTNKCDKTVETGYETVEDAPCLMKPEPCLFW